MKNTGLPCDSCRRPVATRQTIAGFIIDACSECLASEFRVQRMVERAKERKT